MEIKNLSGLRRLAVAAVAINLLAVVIAAIALPREWLVVLPIVGLVLPLLSSSLVDRVAERRLGAQLGAV